MHSVIEQYRHSSVCETPLRDQYSFDCNFSVLACVLGYTCRDKPSWRGHSCDTGDNQRSSGVVIARSRSFGALDHQRRDLHFNRLYLTSRKIGPNLLSVTLLWTFTGSTDGYILSASDHPVNARLHIFLPQCHLSCSNLHVLTP